MYWHLTELYFTVDWCSELANKQKRPPFFNAKETQEVCCTKCVVLREMQAQLCSHSWFQYSTVCELGFTDFWQGVIACKIKLWDGYLNMYTLMWEMQPVPLASKAAIILQAMVLFS